MLAFFIGPDGRIRSGWRTVSFLLVFFSAAIVLRLVEEIFISSLSTDAATTRLIFLTINSVGLTLAALTVGGIIGKLFEQVPFRLLGASFTTGWFRHFILGLVVGGLTLTGAVLLTLVLKGEQFQLNPNADGEAVAGSLCVSFLVFAVGAAWEESFFRGYILQTFVRSGMALPAIVITSAFFGLVHLGNDDATLISTLNTILAGIWFGMAYLKTRDLWFVWGVHLMWNWMQGSFFGIEVSGLTFVTTSPLLREVDSGPTWLTGSNYGIEGGIACTFAIILSIALMRFLPGLKPAEDMLVLPKPLKSSES